MNSALLSVLKSMVAEPDLLCVPQPALKLKLRAQGREEAQGTGNQVTDQEAAFAAVLEAGGFQFLAKGYDAAATADGLYYLYQVNGTQQSLDFQVLEIAGGVVKSRRNLDLKHTTTDEFYLNDGWFHADVIYVVTWHRRISEPRKRIVRRRETFVGFGSHIPTAEETALMAELQAIKTKLNTEKKGVGCLSTYVRFANRYSCARFTKLFVEGAYSAVSSSLSAAPAPAPAPAPDTA